jgi:hypothetical protein
LFKEWAAQEELVVAGNKMIDWNSDSAAADPRV